MLRTVTVMPTPGRDDDKSVLAWLENASHGEALEMLALVDAAARNIKSQVTDARRRGAAGLGYSDPGWLRRAEDAAGRMARLRARVQTEIGRKRDAEKATRVAAAVKPRVSEWRRVRFLPL